MLLPPGAAHLLRAVGQAGLLRERGSARALWLPVTAVAPHRTPGLDSVWRELRGPLSSFVRRRISDPCDAEDVVQDVMLRIHRHADEIERADRLDAWMHQVTRNAIVDFYRRRAARRERPADIADLIEDSMVVVAARPAEPENMGGELARCLKPLIARLPGSYREAVELTELGGLTQGNAAKQLGLSTSGMKARVQRGRAKLRELLLDCCEVELDRRGGVTDYEPRPSGCGPCGARTTR